MPIYAENKGARRNYEILETFEAGIVLLGHEVKAVRAGKCSLKGASVIAKGASALLVGAVISPYQVNNVPDTYLPRRPRQLLLTKRELASLIGATQQGLTLVALKLYNKNSRIKLEFALGKGLKKQDRREKIKRREFERRKKKLLGH